MDTPVTSGDTNSPLPERVTRAGNRKEGPDDWTGQASGPTLRAAGQRLDHPQPGAGRDKEARLSCPSQSRAVQVKMADDLVASRF